MIINFDNKSIGKAFGVSEQSIQLLGLISERAPINQIELTKMMLSNKLKTDKFSKDLIDKEKPSIHRKCWTLFNKKMVIQEPKSAKKRYYNINEKTFEDLREYISSLENNVISNTLSNIPKEDKQTDEGIDVEDFFESELKLYNNGMMSSAIKKLLKYEEELPKAIESKRQRLLGWCYYHLAKKEKNTENQIRYGEEARRSFNKVLRDGLYTDIDSAMNGLILTYEFLLHQSDKASVVAQKLYEQTKNKDMKTSALNTIGLIEMNRGNAKKAITSFDEMIVLAKENKDFRTCAHALNNKARILMELMYLFPDNEKNIHHVESLFNEAIHMYNKSNKKSGESAKFHIDGVKMKLKELKKKVNDAM